MSVSIHPLVRKNKKRGHTRISDANCLLSRKGSRKVFNEKSRTSRKVPVRECLRVRPFGWGVSKDRHIQMCIYMRIFSDPHVCMHVCERMSGVPRWPVIAD